MAQGYGARLHTVGQGDDGGVLKRTMDFGAMARWTGEDEVREK